ncbi:MAG: hypothetical protein MPK31_03235, partial [Gammaproteobacteria bacterium]|nr:hypothetical protein [Gammaproteobacteria bacterium]
SAGILPRPRKTPQKSAENRAAKRLTIAPRACLMPFDWRAAEHTFHAARTNHPPFPLNRRPT